MSLAPAPTNHDAVLHESLRAVVPSLQRCCSDDWCIIGSAAARLIGADVVAADIDVLCTRRDAAALMAHWQPWRDHGHALADGKRFRSHFARFKLAAMPVEIMGDLELCMDGAWRHVQVERMVERGVDGMRVPIPDLAGQIRLLESFDRAKDHQRAQLLRRLSDRGV